MAIIYTYPTKTTPVDNDLILISDSADSNKTKQITVASIKGQTAGVTSIIAGNNVTIDPVGGVGDVTINAAGGGTISVKDSGGAAITGIDTLDFNTNLSLTHTQGSSTATVNVSGTVPGGDANNQIQYKNGNAFDASANLTFSTNTLAVTHTVDIKGDGANAGKLKLYCENTTTPHAVTIEGPAHLGATAYTLKLPSAAPANNQVLQYTTSGNLGWINTPASTAPQGDDGQFQYKNGTSFAGSDTLRFDSDKIHIGKGGASPTRGQLVMYGDGSNASDIQLYNSTNSRSLTLAQQAGATQDLTLTFPGQGSGGNNKILESDSSGQLSWIDTPTAGAVSTYTNANNNYILTSSGTGSINGESSLLYNGSTLTLGTSKVFNASRSTNTSGVATAPIYVTNSTSSSGAPTNFASNIAGGNGSRHIEFYHQGTAVGSITSSTTNIIINGESSDERKKKNIVDWTENVLDKFALIEPKKFNFTHQDDSDPLIKGFIAQQMVDKFPEAYTHDYSISDTEGYYSFNAMGMNVYLMKAIKELKEEIDSLKSRISTLEG